MNRSQASQFLAALAVLTLALGGIRAAQAAEPSPESPTPPTTNEPKADDPKGENPANPAAPAAKPPQHNVILILDCSHSMMEPAATLGGQVGTRLDAGREAIKRLMPQLLGRGHHVGVYFYGHRVGWNQGAGGPAVLARPNVNGIPANLQPYEDVEQVLKLGRFGQQQMQQVANALGAVRPWGESPLNLTIREALSEIPPGGKQTSSIVVITDGGNNVLQPTKQKLVTSDELKNALKRARVPVDVISFALSPREPQQAVMEFRDLAKESGGRYADAHSVKEIDKLSVPPGAK